MTKPTILVVDDEEELARGVAFHLTSEGYEVRVAFNGEEALRLADQPPPPALVLLDVMLPDLTGTEVCRRLRGNAALAGVPVIMVTAKGEEIDRVVGFEVGADDYVTKPFSLRELSLRIRAVLRRSSIRAEPTSEIPGGALQFGVLRIDPSAPGVWVEGEETRVTALELKLLTTLMRRKGRVQTRTTLLQDVWDIHADVTTRTVDTHVKRLREKLGAAGDYIETIRGVGYRFKSREEGEA